MHAGQGWRDSIRHPWRLGRTGAPRSLRILYGACSVAWMRPKLNPTRAQRPQTRTAHLKLVGSQAHPGRSASKPSRIPTSARYICLIHDTAGPYLLPDPHRLGLFSTDLVPAISLLAASWFACCRPVLCLRWMSCLSLPFPSWAITKPSTRNHQCGAPAAGLCSHRLEFVP